MLNKNEKRLLSLLLKNARTTDREIAKKLKITSQAVGKIRKKLEQTTIKHYETKLSYSALGIEVNAIILAQTNKEGIEKGELELEKIIIQETPITQAYRLPQGTTTHLLFCSFRNIKEMEEYLHKKNNLTKYLTIKDVHITSQASVIKKDETAFFKHILETETKKERIRAIQQFKERIT